MGRSARPLGRGRRFVLAWQPGMGICRDGPRLPAADDCGIPRMGICGDTQYAACIQAAGQEIPCRIVPLLRHLCARVLYPCRVLRRYDQLYGGGYLAVLDDSPLGGRFLRGFCHYDGGSGVRGDGYREPGTCHQDYNSRGDTHVHGRHYRYGSPLVFRGAEHLQHGRFLMFLRTGGRAFGSVVP